jgi:translation elongation factor EF-G
VRFPKEYIPGVEKGIKKVAKARPLAGFPMIDFKVDADRRRLPRRRLVGAGVRNRVARGDARSAQKAGPSCSSRS